MGDLLTSVENSAQNTMMKRSSSTSSLYIKSTAAAPHKLRVVAAIAMMFDAMSIEPADAMFDAGLPEMCGQQDLVFNPGGSRSSWNPSIPEIMRYMLFVGVKLRWPACPPDFFASGI